MSSNKVKTTLPNHKFYKKLIYCFSFNRKSLNLSEEVFVYTINLSRHDRVFNSPSKLLFNKNHQMLSTFNKLFKWSLHWMSLHCFNTFFSFSNKLELIISRILSYWGMYFNTLALIKVKTEHFFERFKNKFRWKIT